MERFYTTIASPPDRERLVAEIFCDGALWVEISQEIENGPYAIQFYMHPTKKYWEFQYEDALHAIQQAKNRLTEMDGKL